MLLLVGLGNPGRQHAGHRHNVGFMAVDAVHRRHGFAPWRQRFSAELAEGALDGVRVALLKPQTYMNESGRSVGDCMRWAKLGASDVVAIHDELDLPPGKVRVKTGGGAGGHNGLRSLDSHLGKDYRRVRIGIGHPGHKDRVTGHVLSDFHKSEAEWLDPLLDAVAANAGLLAKGDDAGFMNRVHLATGEAKPAGMEAAPRRPDLRAGTPVGVALPPHGAARSGTAFAESLKKLFGVRDR